MKSEKYSYNSQNRMCQSVVIDREAKTQTVTNYAYDAFGRRILVQDQDDVCLRTLYDGFTFDVIKQSPTLANGMFTDSFETGLRLNHAGTSTGDRYRYIDDTTSTDDGNRYFYLEDGTYKSSSSRYTGTRTSISVNGTLAAQTADGAQQYFTTDLLGSIRTASDSSGFETVAYTYDAFGSLVDGTLSGATDYGYLGKQFDPQTGLYNYGYRDYAPAQARFTTVDPIRDGRNWFAYVNNDPVNFVDLWGLCGSDAQKEIIIDGSNLGELSPDNSSEAYAFIKMAVINNELFGKEYSTDSNNPYVCTTFVKEALEKSGIDSKEYLPGGQKVVDSVKSLDNQLIIPEVGKNPSEGTYVFYHVDNNNTTGHTGIIYFDNNGNAEILHNGSDGKGNENVNERIRSSDKGSFDTWFSDRDNPVVYKKIGK